MTDQLRQTLELNYKLAKESGDRQRIDDAREAIDRASMECQAHTADRIKRIEADVIQIRTSVTDMHSKIADIATSRAKLTEQYNDTTIALRDMQNEIKSWKDQAKGAKKMWDFIRMAGTAIVGAGGGVFILKFFGG